MCLIYFTFGKGVRVPCLQGNKKKKSNHENVISLLLARRKGLDGLCPSLLRNTRLCSPSARGFDSLVFKVTKKEEQPRKRDFSSFGAPEGTRTPDLLVRSQTLYPTELPAHMERMTRLELATSTLARWRSTRWATSANAKSIIHIKTQVVKWFFALIKIII